MTATTSFNSLYALADTAGKATVPEGTPRYGPEKIITIFMEGCGNNAHGEPWTCTECLSVAADALMKHGFDRTEAINLLKRQTK